MEVLENGVQRNTSNFNLHLVNDKIELIDIRAEDDNFLVGSPLLASLEELRLSVTIDNRNKPDGCQIPMAGNYQQRGTPHEDVELARPSYLRKSLAWDSAFFESAGFLDPDELSFINKEFKMITPHLLAGIQDVRTRRSDSESSGKRNKSKRYPLERCGATIGYGSSGLITTKKAVRLRESSPNLSSLGSSMAAIGSLVSSSSVLVSSPQASFSLFRRNTQSKKSKSSTPKIQKGSRTKTRGIFLAGDAKKAPDSPKNSDGNSFHHHESSQIKSPSEFRCVPVATLQSVGSEFPKSFKPSGLRRPSPKIGYFDEV